MSDEIKCECINWARDGVGFRSGGKLLVTNHHPNCPHFNDSLMDVWKVSNGSVSYFTEDEQNAREEAQHGEEGELTVEKTKLHREIFENLGEFEGF